MRNFVTIISRLYFSIATGFFVWFASLQFNDPDAPLWIAGYSIAAIISALVAFDIRVRHLQRMTAIFSGLLCMWMLTLLPDINGYWWVGEVERELGGLGITLITMVLSIFLQRRMSRFA